MQKGNPHTRTRTRTGAGTHTHTCTRTGRGKVLHINVMPSISTEKSREREWERHEEWLRGAGQLQLAKADPIAKRPSNSNNNNSKEYASTCCPPSTVSPSLSHSPSLPPHNACSLRNEVLFCCCVCVKWYPLCMQPACVCACVSVVHKFINVINYKCCIILVQLVSVKFNKT